MYFLLPKDWRTYGDTNVIAIDWSELAEWDYIRASKMNSQFTAQIVKEFIENLMTTFNVHNDEGLRKAFLGKLQVAGHSLGAHIAGRIGHLLKREVGVIYGLDPAGPWFEPPKNGERHPLSAQDGLFVEAIHTATAGNGNIFIVAKQDFYAHGGGLQPGSEDESWSHMKAVNYFRTSMVVPAIAIGYECDHGSGECCNNNAVREFIFGIHHKNRDALKQPIYIPIDDLKFQNIMSTLMKISNVLFTKEARSQNAIG